LTKDRVKINSIFQLLESGRDHGTLNPWKKNTLRNF
jgi:hypothetical protein